MPRVGIGPTWLDYETGVLPEAGALLELKSEEAGDLSGSPGLSDPRPGQRALGRKGRGGPQSCAFRRRPAPK